MKTKGLDKRQQIIDAANTLFYQKGYNPTSFSEIADAAGIPRGNFYYYFKSKDEILAGVIEDRLSRIKTMLVGWDQQFATPKERLKRFIKILLNSADDAARYGCPMGSLNIELGKTQPELQAEARTMFDLFLAWLTRQFAELEHGAKAKHLAQHLLGRTQGVAVIAHAYSDIGFMKREAKTLAAWVDALP